MSLDDLISCTFLSPAIKQAAISLRRQHRLKLPDAIIAATALCLPAELLSNDVKLVNLTCVSVRALALKDSGES